MGKRRGQRFRLPEGCPLLRQVDVEVQRYWISRKAALWALNSGSMPRAATPITWSTICLAKGWASVAPCSSTSPPLAVITTLKSTSAA